MSELWKTYEFANPSIEYVMKIVKDLKNAIIYMRTERPSTSGQIPQKQQQSQGQLIQTNKSNDDEETQFKDESQVSSKEEDTQKTLTFGDPVIVNSIPQTIKEAISLILQFTSKKYQQHILQQAFAMIFCNRSSYEGQNVQKQFLEAFDTTWQQLQFNGNIKYELANKYTTIRENIKTYYPNSDVHNHMFKKPKEDIKPEDLFKNLNTKLQYIQDEMKPLKNWEHGRDIKKPLIKINQLRSHLIEQEPCYDYKQFIKNYGILENEDYNKQHADLLKKYQELFQSFKILESQAYVEAKYAKII